MNPLLYTLPLLAAAYLATADAEEPPEVLDLAQEVESAPVDPMSGKVWDSTAAEWVTLRDYRQRIAERMTARTVEQVPFVPSSIRNGFDVIAERQRAVQQHWAHVFWLRRKYGID